MDAYTKRRAGAPPGFFEVEAAGLRWLQVPGGVPVVPVIAVDQRAITVGRVESIRLDPKSYQALVTMKIDNGFQFTSDTIASILTSGLLGEVYVGLDAGGDTKLLADGGRIGKTQSAVVLEKLIGQFMFSKAAEGGK